MGPSIKELVRYSWQMLNGFRANHEKALAHMRQKDVEPFLGSSHSLRVLDLANGRLRPQYFLLKASGHKVYGIDRVNRRQMNWKEFAYRAGRRLYQWKLGLPVEKAVGQTLICGEVSTLPFPDQCFDLVTSVAAFEHFLDVPKVVADIRRVLRPGGLAWVAIHLFTSPSGGHNFRLTEIPLRTFPHGVDAWDHLRKRRLPFSVPLNEWRIEQYLAASRKHFKILKNYCAMREGEELLTPAIAAELCSYSREELTCGAYVIVARKH